ncbi:MAG: copper amine oxidase N-terminal domain-containing protein [Ruminococcaceae bacterium]|nr:copper amine oxidase N-terminal domain-containing protein [Oscillospiraceae bacterium]
MKKLSAFILAALLLMTFVFAEDAADEKVNDGRVEIEFCVGDATLLINGEEVTVEKPYVVGEGVTLVPVRVITEAFGAEVGWEASTKTITLEYPDVSIVLQIGNPTAEINGRAETLLSAPELTENGFTMVPLRFISENFGAEVGYDNDTKRITVVKETLEEGNTIEGAIENKYIGDSYYGWSMENPKDMFLDYRSFDGMETYFLDDEDCWIDICVYPIDKEYDFDDDFESWKNHFEGFTLMKADKDDSDENHKTMHLQAKNKYVFSDVYVVVTDKYIYMADGGFVPECANKDEFMRILSTFKTEYEGEDIYDLSTVKDGMRTYENEDMKFSVDIPESFVMSSDESAVNDFTFVSSDPEDSYTNININIYSKDSVKSAEEFAKSEQPRAKEIYNENISKVSEVVEKQYENFTAYEYSLDIETEFFNITAVDAYFELGEYVYNISCSVMYDNEEEKAYPEKILSGFKAEELDFDEVGTILYTGAKREGVTEVDDILGCSFEVPKEYEKMTLSSTGGIYSVHNVGVFAIIVNTSVKYTKSVYNEFVEGFEFQISKTENTEIIQAAKNKTIGGKTFKSIIYKQTEGNVAAYSEVYFIVEDGVIYIFQSTLPDIIYSESLRNETTEILRSIEFN